MVKLLSFWLQQTHQLVVVHFQHHACDLSSLRNIPSWFHWNDQTCHSPFTTQRAANSGWYLATIGYSFSPSICFCISAGRCTKPEPLRPNNFTGLAKQLVHSSGLEAPLVVRHVAIPTTSAQEPWLTLPQKPCFTRVYFITWLWVKIEYSQ